MIEKKVEKMGQSKAFKEYFEVWKQESIILKNAFTSSKKMIYAKHSPLRTGGIGREQQFMTEKRRITFADDSPSATLGG